MRFEVRYPTGEPHEVELQGSFAVLGRDPSCDLVLNDVKCSRRHAVVEAGPDGLAVRDTDSANGVFVNGHKVERAKLNEGDLVRLGEIVLRVLPEQITGTVVMGPEDLVDLIPSSARAAPSPLPAGERPVGPTAPLDPPPAPAAPPRPPLAPAPRAAPPLPADAPRPAPELAAAAGDAPARSLPARPLTVQVLSALWLASVLVYGGTGAFLLVRGGLPSPLGAVAAVGGGALALVSVVMAIGLWTLKPWARFLQIAIAAIGILACPMTLASATVLVYMFRKPTALWFSGRVQSDLSKEDAAAFDLPAEATFSLTVLAMVALGLLLCAGGFYLGWRRP
jgi:Inner membrane component of T3SS, cytoplasmic domain